MFKKYLLCISVILTAYSIEVFPSGIQVSNTTVTTNADKKSAQVKFSLTWDHSWRLDAVAGTPSNWDAAWVFIKYRTLPGDNWYHAYVSTTLTAHKIPTNADLKVGTSPAIIGGVNSNPGVGAFIYRKTAGNGTISFQDVELNWSFTQNGLTGGEQVEVCVLATEMVYIPQAAFYPGDLASTNFLRKSAMNGTAPYVLFNITAETIPSNLSNGYYDYTSTGTTGLNYEALVRAAMGTANLGAVDGDVPTPNYTGTTQVSAGYHVALPTAYPKGFAAFYCMKYEITQGEYVQFLNKNLVAVKNGGATGVGYYYPGAITTGRFAIVKALGTGTANIPAVYELSTTSAAYLPCSNIGTKDVVAWLIWAGIRPMTELEFEKVCRGLEPIPALAADRPQFAWGKVDPAGNASGFVNKGMANEGPSNSNGNCAFAPTTAGTNPNMDGPMRAGGFATPVSSREKAGASYYGVMEMSGNLRERCITISLATGRTFNGSYHGNGETGNAATPNLPLNGGWPAVTGTGLGFRGGSYLDLPLKGRMSDRTDINSSDVSVNPITADVV